jgi:hypothetical protein
MRPMPLIVAALVVAACDGAQQTAGAQNEETDWIDGVVAEAEIAPPPSDWIEVPLADNTFREQRSGWRADEIEILVPGDGGGLEYKLGMSEGDQIVYTWAVDAVSEPSLFLSEFHGHTERLGDEPGTVMFYRRAVGASEDGSLVAPFEGVHGWYFQNDTPDDVIVTLKVAGVYEMLAQ